MGLCRNRRNVSSIKQNKSVQNIMFNTEISAFIPPKLKNVYQLGYYNYSVCKSIQGLRRQPL